MPFLKFLRCAGARRMLAIATCALPAVAFAASFSVSPIRADLKAGVLSETITVTNDSPTRLRVLVKLSAWTQDETGQDVYTDSADLVYFPRQMDIEPGGKRLVRVGAKAPAQGTERAYRLFIEEVPAPASTKAAAVSFYFRFGVPVFVTPASAAVKAEIAQPKLAQGKLSLDVSNPGTQHFRAARVNFSDNAGWSRDVNGWYSLPGTTRTYQVEVPPEVCRRTRKFLVTVEAEDNVKYERSVDVDPAACS